MNIYTKVFIGAAAVLVMAVLWFLMAVKPVKAVTDRGDYNSGDPLEVKIWNESGEAVCFSTCFPFYLEKQAGGVVWQGYVYGECGKSDVVDRRLDANGLKKFRLLLDEAESGLHRLKIPVCVGCAAGQQFVANANIFSNSFNIK